MSSSPGSTSSQEQDGYLAGTLLIAMPTMSDPRFERSVIYLCVHSDEGAMGLVLNRILDSITLPDLLGQLGIDNTQVRGDMRIHFGGPVETGRGFVLHSSDYIQDSSLRVTDEVALTATVDILRDIAAGGGPRQRLLALGYAGWGPGQLDREIQLNGWLTVGADEGLVFGDDLDQRWEQALGKLGIDVSMLSGSAGNA